MVLPANCAACQSAGRVTSSVFSSPGCMPASAASTSGYIDAEPSTVLVFSTPSAGMRTPSMMLAVSTLTRSPALAARSTLTQLPRCWRRFSSMRSISPSATSDACRTTSSLLMSSSPKSGTSSPAATYFNSPSAASSPGDTCGRPATRNSFSRTA
ncbi:hypothetical protein SDC9_195311 [bioreactor metagenome]|uniref:Uncharacterized protein n=1 Tax=bioreactor metagenome TaxID=1076179 RepID=A0A645I8N0_9ZZZZ